MLRDRKDLARALSIIAAVVVVWMGISLVVDSTYYRLLLTIIPIWAVLAISWNIFSGYSGLVSFGHGAFFGLGAYTVTLGLIHFELSPWIGVPLAAVLGALAAAAIGYPTFRLRGTYFALAMLAYPLVFVYVFDWLGYQELSLPMRAEAPTWFMQFSDYRVYLILTLGLLAVALVVNLLVEHTRFALNLLAIKQNELAAEACGVDTLRWKLRAITLSGGLAAAAGGLYAVVVLVLTPASVFGLVVSAQAMILTLFGGAGTLWGPLIGASLLVPLSEILQGELGHILPGIQGIIYGAAIIFVMLLAPEGLYWRLRDALASGRISLWNSLWNSRWNLRRNRARPDAIAGETQTVDVPPARPVPAAALDGEVLLAVRGISKAFSGLKAVDDVSFEIRRGEIVGIIGPNGAGKTTLFNLLNGFVRPDRGEVLIAGQHVAGQKPNRICRFGVGRTFQVVRAFPRMTVLQNVVIGAYTRATSEQQAWDLARDALIAVGLGSRRQALATSLTNKEQRLMELARALATGPQLVLLDEPLAGLGASETQELMAIVTALPRRGITVLIIEHTMHAMVALVDRMIVLDHGRFLKQGPPAEVTRDAEVIAAYLGPKWAKKHAVS
jgi:ABC-type branched-subunit amino acid transport system ATPase component/ABC-type branched-subunit amino acid transport system permease subunit